MAASPVSPPAPSPQTDSSSDHRKFSEGRKQSRGSRTSLGLENLGGSTGSSGGLRSTGHVGPSGTNSVASDGRKYKFWMLVNWTPHVSG